MKKTISITLIFLLIIYLMIAPTKAVAAASNGLVLWYNTILPTLLPFAIFANIFISSNCFYLLSGVLYPFVRLLLPVSREGVFPVFAGFLFGFPMGSNICAAMLKENKLSFDEASIIFAISNNMSPVFISSFIINASLGMPQLVIPSFIALYLPPLVIGRILLHWHSATIPTLSQKNTTPRFQLNFKIIDAAIINGFETLTKLGGYIMLFSIIASLIHELPIPTVINIPLFKSIGIGLIEITNGIQYTAGTRLGGEAKYVLMMAFTAFGGLSGLAQTSSMVADTNLPIRKYITIKLFVCLSSTLLALLFFRIILLHP